MCWRENVNDTFTLVSNTIADMLQAGFEDIKGIIRIHVSKKGKQHNDQTLLYKLLHVKQQIEEHEPH